MSASPADVLTAIKNIVTATNNEATTYLNVEGQTNTAGITTQNLIFVGKSRVSRVSVTIAGSAPGMIYDTNTVTGLTRPVYVIPNVVGVYEFKFPMQFGILVNPGAGQQVAVSYSAVAVNS